MKLRVCFKCSWCGHRQNVDLDPLKPGDVVCLYPKCGLCTTVHPIELSMLIPTELGR